MAIYHFSGTIVARSQGRSAVACAAYRSGEKLFDERYQKIQDYTKKQDVVYKNILAPNGAPEWVKNREQLWNEVEKVEKRKDAQLAREFNFSLPKELSLQQNIMLAEEFTQRAFVDRGMVADLNIHVDHKSDGAYYHAHVMLTTRTIEQEGFGQKERSWNSKDLLLTWREQWAEYCNRYLALNGLDLHVDHRTLVEQSIPLEPQHKIGAEAAKEQMARLADHQRIARENGERLLQEPQIALKALTQQQSTFTHHDLARFVNRHTVDADQFSQVYELIKSQNNIVKLGLDSNNRERFSTQEMVDLEAKMMNQALALAEKKESAIPNVARWKTVNTYNLTPEQAQAFNYLLDPGKLKCIVGYAGTGKSYMLGAAREVWEMEGYRVQGVTLSGIAAESLEAGSGITSRTFASRAYYWDRGEELLTKQDVLVVDEAGMLGSRTMARIVDEVNRAGAKLVLVGDPQQLQAIEAGAAFRAITEIVSYQELTEIFRQKENWQKEATRNLAVGEVQKALDAYNQYTHIHVAQTTALAKAQMVNLWNDVRLQNPEISQIMLAYTKVDVQDLNNQARELRKNHGELGKEAVFTTIRGERNFAECDRIYFLKNDRDMGVMNGSLGTVEAVYGEALKVRLDARDGNLGKTVMVDFAMYNHLDHGYAATIHKAQGITVDRSYLLGSKYLDAHASYVGMTRHRESADVFYSQEEFPNYIDLVNSLSRDRAKDVSLDYLGDFKVNQDLQSSLSKQLLQVPLVKAAFPFNKQYSNLDGFKETNVLDVFGQFKAELEKKFGHIERANDLEHKQLLKEKEMEQRFANEQLQFIKNQNRLSEKFLNEHNPQKTYKVINGSETIMGIVGKEHSLLDGRRMIEILKDKKDPCINLVEYDQCLIKERNRYVELKTDHQGFIIALKDTKTMLKEIAMKQRAPDVNLERQQKELARERDLSRGFER